MRVIIAIIELGSTDRKPPKLSFNKLYDRSPMCRSILFWNYFELENLRTGTNFIEDCSLYGVLPDPNHFQLINNVL